MAWFKGTQHGVYCCVAVLIALARISDMQYVSQGLESVPLGIIVTVRDLDFTNNSISIVDHTDLVGLTRLLTLNLSLNRLLVFPDCVNVKGLYQCCSTNMLDVCDVN